MEFNQPVTNFDSFGIDLPQGLPPLDTSQPQLLPQIQSEVATDTHRPDSSQQAPNAAELAVMKEKINKLMKMDNLADITLAGYMIKLLRHRTKMSFRELHDEVSKCYDTLRRSDGSKYTGDLAKALKGCLTSSEIFKEVGDNVWGIREKEAKMYEEKTTKKLKTLINKKKGRSGRKKESEQGEEAESDDDLSGSDDGSVASEEIDKSMPVKKLKQATEEYQKTFNMLELSCKKVRANENTANLIKNPFDGLNDNDAPEEVWKKIGGDRFIGILECFEYFSPLIQEYFKLNTSISAAPASNGKKNKTESGNTQKANGQDTGSKASKGKK